ncbi:MAG TPA: S8 family serine peptidase [Pirellulaceae bacterium]|jgi:subtilisin family serine protease|nr:S8 family serine peptidase [Pirellulaceae bacterium]
MIARALGWVVLTGLSIGSLSTLSVRAQAPGVIPGEYLIVVDTAKTDIAQAAAELRLRTGADVEIVAAGVGILKLTAGAGADAHARADMQAAAKGVAGVTAVENNGYDTLYGEPMEAAPLAASDELTKTSNDAFIGNLWYLDTIAAPQAWDLTTSSSIRVAVVDSGYVLNHEDLTDAKYVNSTEFPPNGLDDDGNGFIDDYQGYDFYDNDNDPSAGHDGFEWEAHGSHVAGSIGATGNNDVGIAGVCWDVELMLLRAGAGRSIGIAAAANAVQYAVDNGAKVINCSFGGPSSEATKRAWMKYAGDRGVLVVVAAGNDGVNIDTSPTFPAALGEPNQITVAALDSVNRSSLAGFSNYGATKVHIGTPGVQIYSTVPSSDPADPGVNSYAYFQGTSMASPITAGAAALVWGQNPSLTHLDVKQILLDSTDKFASLNGRCVSGGRLNVFKAMQSGPPENDPPTVGPLAPKTIECNGGLATVTLYTSVDDVDSSSLTVNWLVNGVVQRTQSNVSPGTLVFFTYDYGHGETAVQLDVSDGELSASQATTVTLDDTTSPIVTIANSVKLGVDRGKNFASLSRLPKPAVHDVCDPNPQVVNNALAQLPLGSSVVTWTVTDLEGNKATARQNVTVVNTKPKAKAGRDIRKSAKSSKVRVKLNGRGSLDPDKHALKFRWSAKGVKLKNPTSPRPTGLFPVGTTLAKLTVTDALGAKSTDTVRIIVKQSRARRSNEGALADAYAAAAYSHGYQSFAGSPYDPAAEAGYALAESAYLLGAYAGDEDATLRSHQAALSGRAGEFFLQAYRNSGDSEALRAGVSSLYGQAYGQASLSDQ